MRKWKKSFATKSSLRPEWRLNLGGRASEILTEWVTYPWKYKFVPKVIRKNFSMSVIQYNIRNIFDIQHFCKIITQTKVILENITYFDEVAFTTLCRYEHSQI